MRFFENSIKTKIMQKKDEIQYPVTITKLVVIDDDDIHNFITKRLLDKLNV
jgi:hypothetical protein